MKNGILHSLIASLLVAAALPGSARAEVFTVCQVMPTNDGFVALRAKPTVKGQLVARMKTGEMAVIDVKNGDYVQSGKWLSVSYHSLAGHTSTGEEDWRFIAKGWAFTDYINECG